MWAQTLIYRTKSAHPNRKDFGQERHYEHATTMNCSTREWRLLENQRAAVRTVVVGRRRG